MDRAKRIEPSDPFEVQSFRSGAVQAAAEQFFIDVAKLEAEKADKGAKRQ
jgi:hypothetical protein